MTKTKKKKLKLYHVNLWGDWYNIKAYSTSQLYLKLFFKLGFHKVLSQDKKMKLMHKIKDEAKIEIKKYDGVKW